jgi:RNA polymerase sigma-70 factor, ECF subfamily
VSVSVDAWGGLGEGSAALAPPVAVPSETRTAVERTLVNYYPGIVAAIFRRAGGDRQLALDVLQDAIVTALAKVEGGAQMDPRVVAGFVVRTAFNHLKNRDRRERFKVGGSELLASLPDGAQADPFASSDAADLRAVVRKLLERMTNRRDREVLVRFYLHEQERAQVCDGLGISESQFDRVVSRARERMRAVLARSGITRGDVLVALIVVLAL